jgi:hypothetical protein
MSLQQAAQHLAAHGRGPDTTLVHMTPDEVKSLNNLAMAHGGQLTINPHTGLPEAGFLSSILPMLAGAALGPAGFGLFESAMTAGLGVGALTGLATGSLSKGLMAGLGAYGGAGLGGALAESGMQAAASAAPEVTAANQAAYAPTLANAQSYQMAAQPGFVGPQISPEMYSASQLAAQAPAAAAREAALAGQKAAFDTGTFGNKIGTMFEGAKTGLGNIASNTPGGGMGLAKYGLAAAAPIISNAMQPKTQMPMATDKDMGQRYTYSPNKVQGPYTASPTGVEQRYFNPTYTPIGSDQARNIYGFADGGVATATPMPGEKPSYQYDPMKQLFAKIESIPSDDQNKQKAEMQAQRQGNVHTPMTDAQFAAQKAQGEANMNSLNSFGDTVGNGILSFLSQPPLSVQLLQSLLGPNGLAIGIGSMPGDPGTGVGYGGTAASGSSNMGFTNNAPTGQTPANSGSGESGMNAGGGGRGGGGGGNSSGIGIGMGGVNGSAGTATSTSNGNTAAANGGLMATGGLSEAHYNLGGMASGGPTGHLRPPPAFFQNGKYSFHPAKMYAEGGVPSDGYNLGGYSDGGRLLRGPGDGVSDSIPATIGHKQPARLADGEFVVPARIVSELGNGSTEAGARKLYAMMDRVQSARSKTVGKGKIAKNSSAEKYLPA